MIQYRGKANSTATVSYTHLDVYKRQILNCSLNAPHPLVRTYYPRMYEVTYLLGMLAGVLTKTCLLYTSRCV